MDVIGYTESGMIRAVIDGVETFVPDDMGNRHRRQVKEEWEDAGKVIPLYVPPAPTEQDVMAERARRLAAGFDFEFPDARGVHRIGTTKEDLVGWDEVSKLASAAINLGLDSQPIGIVTDTGPVLVTALEWQQVLLAAAAFRQPIFSASFVLQSMDPIPADYATNAAYWPGA